MKILIVNAYPYRGGAARAARRLFLALQEEGADVQFCSIYDEKMDFFRRLKYLRRVAMDRLEASAIARKRVMFSRGTVSNSRFVRFVNNSDFDIIHLHWMNAGAVSVEDLTKINKKIVWTMHDNWLFTGGCHVFDQCRRYAIGCGRCPLLHARTDDDLSSKMFRLKRQVFSSVDFQVVSPSAWLASQAAHSAILRGKKIDVLPNPINCKSFYPESKAEAKHQLGIPAGQPVVLFGANSFLSDPNKGYSLLVEALASSADKKYTILVFGVASFPYSDIAGHEVISFGVVASDAQLRLLYSASDVTVVPSRQENLSNTIIESMACGTPVVSFDVGGNADIVTHRTDGYLAEPFDTLDLARGIRWVVDAAEEKQIGSSCADSVRERFDYPIMAKQFLSLYRTVIHEAV